ncbi:MAG: hypothetical protein OHK0046_16530 [Anaerolineae bacterium]
MPYPAQISRTLIVETAWVMIATQGFDHLSLSELATELGVKAPSLYRHVENKAELLKAMNELTMLRMFQHIMAALGQEPARDQLLRAGLALWDFAHTHPNQYMLALGTVDAFSRPDVTQHQAHIQQLQTIMGQISGEAHARTAMRGALSLIHGFIVLMINQQLSPNETELQADFQQAFGAYLDGWR